MKRLAFIAGIVCVMLIAVQVHAQQRRATKPTEVIGRICKTMEEHPAPTPEANYALLDYAVCGPGGLRVYPIAPLSREFRKIKFGVQGGKRGKDVVYLHGYTRTVVLPAFGPHGSPAHRPRFRFSWLEVDRMRRGMPFSSKPLVRYKKGAATVAVKITNPLDKPIRNTEVVINLKSANYPHPVTKTVPVLQPGMPENVVFEIVDDRKPKGTLLIKNYGRVYIEIAEKL